MSINDNKRNENGEIDDDVITRDFNAEYIVSEKHRKWYGDRGNH